MAFLDLNWQLARPSEGFYNSQVESPRPLPVRTFLPTAYEPRYPYPLLVFLHGQGGNEEHVLRYAPRISRRNFVSISLRGPACVGARPKGGMGYSWGDESQLSLIEDYVLQACQQTRLHYHVHSERIYLIGVGEGASLAYRLGLTFPDKFAGVVSLNGAMPRHHRPLMRLPEVRSLKVFIGHGFANATIPLPLAREDYRLLYSAGASVQFNSYATNHRLHADMLRDVNRWVVNHCEQGILPPDTPPAF